MSQRLLLTEEYFLLLLWRDTQSRTPVTMDTISLEMQTGPVSLMDSGQGLSQSVFVRSMYRYNAQTEGINT